MYKWAIDKIVDYSLEIHKSKTRPHILDLCKHQCTYCGKFCMRESGLSLSVGLQLEHMVPGSKDGDQEFDLTNLTASCWKCNSAKGAKYLFDKNSPNYIEKIKENLSPFRDYANNIKRDQDGRLVSLNDIGDKIIKMFNFRDRDLHIIWNIQILQSLLLDKKEKIDEEMEAKIQKALYLINVMFSTNRWSMENAHA